MQGLSLENLPFFAIGSGAIFWTFLYLLAGYLSKRIFPFYSLFAEADRVNWDSRVVSLVHAVVASLAVIIYYLCSEGYEDVVFGNTAIGRIACTISSGFFAWDMGIVLLKWKVFGFPLILHAFYCVTVFSGALLPLMQFYATFFLSFECSSIFLNTYFLMQIAEENTPSKQMPKQFTRFQSIIGVLFAISFVIIRLVLGNYYYFHYWREAWARPDDLHPMVWNFYRLMTLFSGLLNAIWFIEIIKKAVGAGTTTPPIKKEE